MPVEEKQCTKCEHVKPLTEFRKNKNSRNGITSRCRACLIKDHIRYAARYSRASSIEPEDITDGCHKWPATPVDFGVGGDGGEWDK